MTPDQDNREEPTDQEDEARASRDTGGDAPAAGSVDEREAVAADGDDEPFDADDGEGTS